MIAQHRLAWVAGLARMPSRVPRWTWRVIAALLVTGALLACGWLWVRDSSLVAVRNVTIVGASGPDAAPIRSALTVSARSMTTLDVRIGSLRTAVAPYPVVKDLKVTTHFPHGIRIRVIEEVPIAAVSDGGRAIAVAGDGTLLHDVAPSGSLPVIPLSVPPGGAKVTERGAAEAVALLAAAPYAVLARVSQATTLPGHGLTAQLRSGPSIYFGDSSRLRAKWLAAIAVLGDPGSAAAPYVDVTDPQRPVSGAALARGVPGT